MTRNELQEEILQLVNASEDMTYSDIQGVAMAISMKAIKE
jgi:hypothetical protein